MCLALACSCRQHVCCCAAETTASDVLTIPLETGDLAEGYYRLSAKGATATAILWHNRVMA
jgi:hypothetical protein